MIGAWHRPQQAVSAGRPLSIESKEWTDEMIVLGADMHKRSHTVVAVAALTGELVSDQSVLVGADGFRQLLVWARAGRRAGVGA